MSHGLLTKKKEHNHQHPLMLQQHQQITQLQSHHSFPSPVTPTFDKKVLTSPSSSCRFDTTSNSGYFNGSNNPKESSTTGSLYSSPSSNASTPGSTSQRNIYGQFPFNEVYGSSGNFLGLRNSYDLTRSCSALPSPTIYPPTPPPSAPWIHPAWFGSMESVGFMKTPKTNPFDN